MNPNFNIWYTSDEVRDYHPIVEWSLNKAIDALHLQDIYTVIHHYNIPGSSTIPDFALIDNSSKRVVFVVEVKRNKAEVESQRYWNQARGYVRDLKFKWKPNSPLYYCVTNIEELLFFCEREAPISSCLLIGNPYKHTDFDPELQKSKVSADQLTNSFKSIIEQIHRNATPVWVNNWNPLVHSFMANYLSLAGKVNLDSEQAKEISLYELLRLLFYGYLREYYLLNGHSNASYFSDLIRSTSSSSQFGNLLKGYFDKVLQLDFRQIFSEYPLNEIHLINSSKEIIEDFKDFVVSLEKYIKEAVKENSSPPYFFNLLSSEIYEREELHNKGKVMTDPELATLLVEMTLSGNEKNIIDPGCGDGSLLSASYDKLMSSLNLSSGKNHQELINRLHGREIDPFLSQLASFRLLAKNFESVNPSTYLDITPEDIFEKLEKTHYDAVVMNPPFLRNDDSNAPITNKEQMIESIKKAELDCFVEDAKQPNLLYYFVNYAWHYLKNEGHLGAILMTKVLNNQDGTPFKKFIKDKVDYIVQYPRSYFPEFKVTTCIIVCTKRERSKNVIKFVNIKNPSVLEDINSFGNEIKAINSNEINPNYSVKLVNSNDIKSSDNWRLFLIDPEDKFNKFNNHPLLSEITSFFKEIKRGQSDNSGGTNFIYYESIQNPLADYTEGLSESAITQGLKNNRSKRYLELTKEDLYQEKAIKIPKDYAELLDLDVIEDPKLKVYLQKGRDHYGEKKWKKIVSEAYRSRVNATLIIPRADRKKHTVYLNNSGKEIVISSNFTYLSSPIQNKFGKLKEKTALAFIEAYLVSSFGQIQFEVQSNNQEGMRKFEKRSALKLKVIDPSRLSESEINTVIERFNVLNSANCEFLGLEISDSPRKELDLSIANILFTHDPQDYGSTEDLYNDVKRFLFDLVEGRSTQ